MTLEELAYIIGGSLEITDQGKWDTEGFEIELRDSLKGLCVIMGEHNGFCRAISFGNTQDEARNKLAELIKGKILFYELPPFWTDPHKGIRIPATLIG